ncbi:DsrE family protein [Burkholderia sp. MR1]|nr:DsrE family protein [Burkholderia sp. MR1]
MTESNGIKVLIHAATPEALKRARQNALNLVRAQPNAQVRIMVNGSAVSAVLESAAHETDPLTWLCPNTLANVGKDARAPMQVMEEAAILLLARLQHDGWAYVRA